MLESLLIDDSLVGSSSNRVMSNREGGKGVAVVGHVPSDEDAPLGLLLLPPGEIATRRTQRTRDVTRQFSSQTVRRGIDSCETHQYCLTNLIADSFASEPPQTKAARANTPLDPLIRRSARSSAGCTEYCCEYTKASFCIWSVTALTTVEGEQSVLARRREGGGGRESELPHLVHLRFR